MNKIRITQSLLSSWEWTFKKESGWDDFLATLHREKKPPTEAMLDGIRFENVLNAVLNGEQITEDNEWFAPITEMADELCGSQQQVTLFRDIEVDGQPILLHGVLDYLREGIIWDCKFSKRYGSNGVLNKYLSSPQCPLYLTLCPEVFKFIYIISDGKYVYREVYPREIMPPIEPTIKNFLKFVDNYGLRETLEEKWSVRN